MGSDVVVVGVAYPPSVNRYYRRVGPRTLISAEGRAYRERVRESLVGMVGKPFLGGVRMTVDVFPPDRRRRDLDNVLKALLDALESAGVYGDDSQVAELHVFRRGVVDGGRVLVELASLA